MYLPRQVMFLSCCSFLAWYFCWSFLSLNNKISNLTTLYWGHICKRSKGRVFLLLSGVFSVLSQCGIMRRVDKMTGKERMVANLGCLVEKYPSSTFHPFSGISATKASVFSMKFIIRGTKLIVLWGCEVFNFEVLTRLARFFNKMNVLKVYFCAGK